MKTYISLILLMLSFSSIAFGRVVILNEVNTCSSTIERNTIGSFSQKSKVKNCAQEGSKQTAINTCQNYHYGEVKSVETSFLGCESQIVWGGRYMRCGYRATVKCDI